MMFNATVIAITAMTMNAASCTDAETRRLAPATTKKETKVRVHAMVVRSGCNPGSGCLSMPFTARSRSEEHTSELQSRFDLVCRLLLEKKKSSKDPYN